MVHASGVRCEELSRGIDRLTFNRYDLFCEVTAKSELCHLTL